MNLKGASILVTGGAGFAGSCLVEQLVARGAQVTVVDNLARGKRENLAAVWERIRFEELDTRQDAFLDLLVAGRYDLVFHLAAVSYVPDSVRDPQRDLETNLLATFRLVETIRANKLSTAVINTSSAAVYGDLNKVPLSEGDLCIPVSPYGVSKLAGERYLDVYAQLYGLRGASMRFFSLFGPRQEKQVVFDFIRKLHDNPHQMLMFGDGSQVRDLNYVENAVDAALCIAENAPLQGEVYNVAAGHSLSILGLAQMIAQQMGVSPAYTFTGSVRPGDPQKWVADIARLRALGYEPRIDLEEGMRRTLAWFRSRST